MKKMVYYFINIFNMSSMGEVLQRLVKDKLKHIVEE